MRGESPHHKILRKPFPTTVTLRWSKQMEIASRARLDRWHPTICFFIVLAIVLLPGISAGQNKEWHVHPPWYDPTSHSVNWDKYPGNQQSTSALSSGDSLPVLSRWQWGVCYAADVRGNYAYIGNGDLFQVLDLSNPSNPMVVAELALKNVGEIVIRDSIAHVLGSRYFTVDISDPFHPTKLGELYLPWPMRVIPTDTFAYVSYFGGLAIVDITDPANPTIRNSGSFPGEFGVGLAVKDRTVFLSFEDYPGGLYIIDVSDPDAPSVTYNSTIGFYSGLVSDSLLITAGAGYFAIYDVKDPFNPARRCSLKFGEEVEHKIYSIAAESSTVYLGSVNAGVFAIDIADLENPVLRDSLKWPYTTTYELWNLGLQVLGSHLIASNTVGLSVIDKSNPDSLVETTFFPTGGVHTSVDVRDSIAVIGAGMAGVWILDISDPIHPRPLANVLLPHGFTSDVLVSDSIVYAANWMENPFHYDGRGVWIIGIEDIAHPQILSHHIGIAKPSWGGGHKTTIALEDGLLYLTQVKTSTSDSVLEIIDVRDPGAPITAGVVLMPYSPYRFWVKDSIAYLATSNGGLRIVDCHDPSTPVELSSLFATARGIAVQDTLAFVAATSSDIFIYNISSPNSPAFISWLDMPNGWQAISNVLIPATNFLYWASDNTKGIIDIIDPTTPSIHSMENGRTTDVMPYGNTLIYTLDEHGTVIVQNPAILNVFHNHVSPKWNLVSLPMRTASPVVSFNYPTSSVAYSFSGGAYQVTDSLEIGRGYWIRADSALTFDVWGTPIPGDTIPLATGWNLVGGLTEALSIGEIDIQPESTLVTPFYGYNGGYVPTDTILPGKGYWIKSSNEAQLILSPGSGTRTGDALHKALFIESNRLKVTDRLGHSQTLYFKIESPGIASGVSTEMPPAHPAQELVARFAPDAILAEIAQDESVGSLVRVDATEYPLTIEWEINERGCGFEIEIDGIAHEMKDGGKAVLTRAGAELRIRSAKRDPTTYEFRVSQNYPNPFNSTTRISLTLPEAGSLTLRLLNVLGETVRIRQDEVRQPGEYSFQLDLSELPSGIYFYQIQTAKTVIMRKLSFLK